MSKYSELIDNMVFSFSRLQAFYQCPYQWKFQYIDGLEGENNFFAEYGNLVHSILEKYAKGEAEIYELPLLFEEQYDEFIQHPAPPNKFCDLRVKYFEEGKAYFENFEGFGDYEIVDAEREFLFNIDNIKIKGYADLILRDKDGNLHVVDHKSSDPKSARSQKAREYWKQMYLYAIPIKEEYGVYPVKLHINAFRKNQWFTVKFNKKNVDTVKKWVIDTVELIKKEEQFLPLSDGYFCNFLCNFRGICEYVPQVV